MSAITTITMPSASSTPNERIIGTSASSSVRKATAAASVAMMRDGMRLVVVSWIGCGARSSCTSSSTRLCIRSEEHTSELQSLMRISYAVFCLKKNITISELITHNISPTKKQTHIQHETT